MTSLRTIRRRLRFSGQQAAGIALALTLLLAATAFGAHEWVRSAFRQLGFETVDIRFRLVAARTAAATAPPSRTVSDYTQSLPQTVSVDKLAQTLQQSAQAFNAVLTSVTGEPHAQTEGALPRLEVSVSLKGSYPALKSTLAEALDRFPNAVIEELAIKRDSSPGESEEMTARILLPLRPSRQFDGVKSPGS